VRERRQIDEPFGRAEQRAEQLPQKCDGHEPVRDPGTGVSPAAISGAARYLIQLNLVSREREPGSRRAYYRVHADAWYEAAIRREQMLAGWQASVREGLDALGRATPAGARIAESLAFFDFLQAEMPEVLERWRQRRTTLRTGRTTGR